MDIDQNVLQTLLDSNPRFRMLYEEHILFEKQLSEYEKKGYLSPQEELEKNKVVRSPQERIALRNSINIELGIYQLSYMEL